MYHIDSHVVFRFEQADDLRLEIDKKRDCYNSMVGTLYPPILWNEICKLSEQYKAITGFSYYGRHYY